MGDVSKTSLLIFLVFFTIAYAVASTALIGWYFDSQIENYDVGESIHVKYALGVPYAIETSLTDSVLSESLQMVTDEARYIALINLFIVTPILVFFIWMFIPTG